MNCCAHNQGLRDVFNEDNARAELKEYWKKGLDKHSRRMVEAASARGVTGATVLEVGAGVGGLHAALLQRGAASATDVDASPAYLAAAQQVSEKLGLRGKIEYRHADFAAEAAAVPAADVVVMHRVVCCYPDMPQLVAAAAGHARRALVLSFPRAAWYSRLFIAGANLWMRLTGSGFRIYVHEPARIAAIARSAGLRLAEQKSSWPWQIMAFERAG
jgi:magnesium-protoporphyrin O-methyltransferase